MTLTLVASAARTASSNSGSLAVPHLRTVKGAIFLLNVSSAGSLVGDKLNVYLQSSVDGDLWDDFAHFTEVLGNGGAKQFIATWFRDMSPESELKAPSDKALAAGVLQGPVAVSHWRVAWVITDGGGTHSFTFSVKADLLR